jgi:hypothetical protein
MLKATLRFTNYLNEDKRVFRALANCEVQVLKSKFKNYSTQATVTILVVSNDQLNFVLDVLNHDCVYGVSVIKVKRKWF